MLLMKQLFEISLEWYHKLKTEDGSEPLQIMVLNRPLAVCFSSPVHKMSSYVNFLFRCLLNYCCHSIFNLTITQYRMRNVTHHRNHILHAYTKFKITKYMYTLRKGLYHNHDNEWLVRGFNFCQPIVTLDIRSFMFSDGL